MAAEYNIDVVIGDSWPPGPDSEFVVTVREGPSGGPYTEIDLTGTTITQLITHKNAVPTDTPVLTLSVKDQVSNTGEIGIRLNATESAKLSNLTYHWRLVIEFDTENILTPIAGQLKAVSLNG